MAVPLLFVAASCASEGEGSEEEPTEVTQEASVEGDETDEPATDEPAAEEPAADEPASDEPVADDSTGDEPAADPAEFAGDAGSEWCVAAREVETLSDQLDSDALNFADPAAVEAAYTGFVEAIDDAVAVAPPEIAADVETTARGFRLLSDALASVEWNFLDADLSVIDELDAEMTAAGDRIGDYNEQVCGIAQDDDGDDVTEAADDGSDFDPSAGTPREQMAAGLVTVGFTPEEADCIVDQVDIAAYLETNDEQLILDAFDACEIPLARLAELTGG